MCIVEPREATVLAHDAESVSAACLARYVNPWQNQDGIFFWTIRRSDEMIKEGDPRRRNLVQQYGLLTADLSVEVHSGQTPQRVAGWKWVDDGLRRGWRARSSLSHESMTG